MYSVKPQSSLSYAWDFPASREKKLALSIKGARRVVDIMEIGDLVPFKFSVSFSDCVYDRILTLLSFRMVSERELYHLMSVPMGQNKSCESPIITQNEVYTNLEIGPVPCQGRTRFQATQKHSRLSRKK